MCGELVNKTPAVEILQAAEGAAPRMTGAYLRNGTAHLISRRRWIKERAREGACFGKRPLQKQEEHKARGKAALHRN
jgi:hypothetical protein